MSRLELYQCNLCGHPKGSGGLGEYLLGITLKSMKNHYLEKHPNEYKELLKAIEDSQ